MLAEIEIVFAALALIWGLPTLVGTLLVVTWHRRLTRPTGVALARSPHPSGRGR